MPNDQCIATVKDNRGTYFYSSFEDSWKHAVMKNDCDVTLTLYQDWTASDGWFGNDGTDGFKNGQFYPLERTTWLTFDLNGHTLDAGLTNARKNGRIFYFDEDCNMIIKNGRLTGAYSNNKGGAIYLNDGDVDLQFENIMITGNKSEGPGSAIYFYEGCSVKLINVTITENTVIGNFSDGAVFYKKGYLTLEGVVEIYNNTSKGNHFGDLFIFNEPEAIKCNNLQPGSKISVSQKYSKSNYLIAPVDDIDKIKNYFIATEGSRTTLTVTDENDIIIKGYVY